MVNLGTGRIHSCIMKILWIFSCHNLTWTLNQQTVYTLGLTRHILINSQESKYKKLKKKWLKKQKSKENTHTKYLLRICVERHRMKWKSIENVCRGWSMVHYLFTISIGLSVIWVRKCVWALDYLFITIVSFEPLAISVLFYLIQFIFFLPCMNAKWVDHIVRPI